MNRVVFAECSDSVTRIAARRILVVLIAVAPWLPAPCLGGPIPPEHDALGSISRGASMCIGDCDGDGVVSPAEFQLCISIAGAGGRLPDCRACDGDGDGQVTIDDYLLALEQNDVACLGVPGPPTSTVTPTRTRTSTPDAATTATPASALPTATRSPMQAATQTMTHSRTPTFTRSATPAATRTRTASPASPSPTVAAHALATRTPTRTATHRLFTATRTPTATTIPEFGIIEAGCPGDCNDDGRVTAAELLAVVGVAHGDAPVTSCPAADVDLDGLVTEDEVQRALQTIFRPCTDRHAVQGSCVVPGPTGLRPCSGGTPIDVFSCPDAPSCFSGSVPVAFGFCGADGRFTLRLGSAGRGQIVLFRAEVAPGVWYRSLYLGFAAGRGFALQLGPVSEALVRILLFEQLPSFDLQGLVDLILAVLRACEGLDFAGMSPSAAAELALETATEDSAVADVLRCLRTAGTGDGCGEVLVPWELELIPDPGQIGCGASRTTMVVARDGLLFRGRSQVEACNFTCPAGAAICEDGSVGFDLSGLRSGQTFLAGLSQAYSLSFECPAVPCAGQCRCEGSVSMEGVFSADESTITGRYDFAARSCTASIGLCNRCFFINDHCVGSFTVRVLERATGGGAYVRDAARAAVLEVAP